jgi:signal transduction histidine kinase
MKLRNRLLTFGTAQLVLFGVLLLVAYRKLDTDVLPMAEDHLQAEAMQLAARLSGELEVPLGADDPILTRQAVALAVADPDVRYVEVRDARGATIFAHGTPSPSAFAGGATTVHVEDGAMRVWMPIAFESIKLGAVVVALDTGRVDGLRNWVRMLAVIVAIAWLGALGYSIVFAQGFVAPIHAMMTFSHGVAAGDLAKRLEIDAAGELRELVDDLNAMTAQLELREHERATAARTAAELQRALLVLTRKAGMAEVATGVLHDVGNVLNSLNVSISLVGESIRTSKVAQLAKVVELCGDTPAGLTAFLATARGTAMPKFLASVSQRLVEENSTVGAEIASVASNVEHIKVIVAMQQALARVGGIVGPVVLSEVIEDALQLSDLSLARHGITIVRDFAELPRLESDRHKILQILVNLISNSLHALKDQPVRELTLRLARRAKGVAIVVGDTGVGIAPEHLERIFRHGFTTRIDGHGFGLHASANSVAELGGSIAVASDGVGRGATFTVELPLACPEAHDAIN